MAGPDGTSDKPKRPRRRGAKRSRARRVARIVGIVIAVPIVLVLLLLLGLHTGPGQRWVRDTIQKRAAERLNGTLSIGELDFALFGSLELRRVSIRDEAGQEVVALDSLVVAPAWSSLTSDAPTVDRIALDGLRLHLVQDEEGKLNLKALIKPRPPEPPKPPEEEPAEPKKTRIVVRELHLGDIDVTLDKPDGTRIALERFGLDGTVDVTPATKSFKVHLPRIAAELGLEKKQDGLKLGVSGFQTGLRVDLVEGAGQVELSRTEAHAKIEQRGAPVRETDLDLGSIRFDIEPGKLGAAIDKLVVGALALQSLEVRGQLAEGSIAGEQKVQLVGLRVDAIQLNELLGRELLGSDVDVAVKLSGPPERIVLDTDVRTGGGELAIDGTVDISDRGQPRFDLTVVGSLLDAKRLVLLDKVPEASIHQLTLNVSGCGSGRDNAHVDLGLHIDRLAVDRHVVDQVLVGASYDDGLLRIDPLLVDAYAQEVMARGSLDLGTKQVDVGVTFEGDVGETLAALRKAGLKVTAQLPRGAVAYRRGTIDVHVSGDLEGQLDADVDIRELGVAGGTVSADVHAELWRNAKAGPDEPKVRLRDIDGTVELRNVGLKQVAALRGKKLEGVTGTVSGRVDLGGQPEAPEATLELEARVQPTDEPGLQLYAPTVVATVKGHATKTDADLKVSVRGQHADQKLELLTADVHAPLVVSDEHKGLATHRPLRVEVDIPERDIQELLPYLPKRLKVDSRTGKPRKLPEGKFSARVKLGGTAARPEGKIDADVRVAALPGATQRLKLDATVTSEGPQVVANTKLKAWLHSEQGPVLEGKAQARLSRSPLVPGPRDLSWSVDLNVPEQDLAALPVEKARALGLAGTAGADIELRGNQSDLYGSVGVKLDNVVVKGKGPVSGTIGLDVKPEGTAIDTDVQLMGQTVLRTKGTVARSGKGLLAALRDKTPGKSTVDKLGNPAIDVKVELPEHPTAAYLSVAPALAAMPGQLHGAIDVAGDVKTPTAKGQIVYDGFTTIDGTPGRAAVNIDASASDLGARVQLGHVSAPESSAPVEIAAKVSRPGLKTYLEAKRCYSAASEALEPGEELLPGECPEGGELPIEAHIAAADVNLTSLVPDFALSEKDVKVEGQLSWRLDSKVILDPKPRYAQVGSERVKLPPISPDSTLDGELSLHDGTFTIPGTGRRVHDVKLVLGYNTGGIDLRSLSARESDLQRKNRALDVTGRLTLESWRPQQATIRIQSDEWLVHGTDQFGPTDAPRTTLSADIGVKAGLDQPVKRIDVKVASLHLLTPDRFRRAHEPESTHLGDVIYLDETPQPAGKLPVPTAALEEDAEDPFAHEYEKKPTEPQPESGFDVHVEVPNKIHLLLFPMDLWAVGAIDVQKRADKTHVDGKLNMVGGQLALGGRQHKLQKGHFLFNDEYPGGFLELWFARREHNATLRDISEASGGRLVKIHMIGPLSKRKTTLSGAGSPGTLYDLLSVHNAGRQRYVAQPDMPASMTVEYPQHPNLLMLSYLASNVPHMLFLDRIAAWSDAYEGRGTSSYGEVRHLDAQGYNEEGTWRVRAEVRERGAGQSASELGFDWLWVNTPQTAVGVGLNAGSRLGGGPGLFFEWSSKD